MTSFSLVFFNEYEFSELIADLGRWFWLHPTAFSSVPVSARSVAWFLLMKFMMSERRACTAHALRSRPSMILNRSEGFADTQADMNCVLQFQCVMASMMAG